MKALILAGGRGNRINEFSENQNKCIVELSGKPLIEYSLENAVSMGVDEIVIVVGYKAEEIINVYGTTYCDKNIRYVLQYEQKGLVHAIECSKKAIGKDDFALFLGDEITINTHHQEMFKKFVDEDLFAICGIIKEGNKSKISKTYTIIQDEDHRIFRLIEKPRAPFNNLMGTGNCIFKNKIFSYIDRTPINQERGEKELPDLIQCAIDEGNVVKSFFIAEFYSNINSLKDLKNTMDFLVKDTQLF